MAKGIFIGLTLAQLTDMQTKCQEGLVAILVAGQSYSISGRSFNRANVTELQNMMGEINYALELKSGTAKTMTVAGFGTPYSGS
jgi:hypothetical protein